MLSSDRLAYDTATFLSQGRRGCQEDAIATDFCEESDVGFVVLGDGMGGHTSGEIASNIAVSEVYRILKRQSEDPEMLERRIGDVLYEATAQANASVGQYTLSKPETQGMGTTLLSPVIVRDKLYWLSIGDSPLYIFRDDRLLRLNQNHTLHDQFEQLVKDQVLEPNASIKNYADCLTSAIIGCEIAQIDCNEAPVTLVDQDILIAASDGLQYLDDEEICEVLTQFKYQPAEAIGKTLMAHIDALNDPEQDNVACCVIKVGIAPEEHFSKPIPMKPAVSPATMARPSTLVAMLRRSKQKIQCRVSLRSQH